MPEAEQRAAGRERHRRLVAGESGADWSGLRYRFDGTPIRLRFRPGASTGTAARPSR